jgi:hypothetical protein
MLNLSFTSEHKGEVKTLKLTKNPFHSGPGIYKDVNGEDWDIHSLIGKTFSSTGKAYVTARKVSDAPNYYSTASYSNQNGFHKWEPYYFEIISQEKNK